LGKQWFVHRAAPDTTGEAELRETPVAGLVVVTQTCDVVRKSEERPFVEVSPLVALAHDDFDLAARGRRPRYAVVPALADRLLVADLDRTMTIEKSVVASWYRVAGCRNDAETRAFAGALARKRERFAFPDDFNRLVGKLRARLVEKHDKQTEDGRALRRLREIRVQVSPAWTADNVELFFWFIRDEQEPVADPIRWQEFLARWIAMVRPEGRFASINGQVVGLADMTARDYVESDRLDLDYLSAPAPVDGE
jgi:hypothetical protein